MRQFFSLVVVALVSLPMVAFGADIKKGDTAKVPGWEWVDVKNLQTVPSGNTSFSYGDSCGIQRGGVVMVVGIDGNRVLVRYAISGAMYGTPCPDGVVFFISKERFSKMTAEYHSAVAAENADKNLIKKLLGK